MFSALTHLGWSRHERQTVQVKVLIKIEAKELRAKTGFHGARGKVLNGWELTSIVSWRSGFPFSIVDTSDNSFSGVGRDRADFIGSSVGAAELSSSRSHPQLVQEWFNPAVFGRNAVGTFGDTGKTILRGPRFFETDLGI